jgi:DNA-binding XRE family transcriptional regulator
MPLMYIIRFWRKGWFLLPFCQLVLRAVRLDSPPCARDRRRLAQSLTGYRSRQNLTQQALAAKLGVNQKTLNNWENGRSRPIWRFWREIRSLLASHLA